MLKIFDITVSMELFIITIIFIGFLFLVKPYLFKKKNINNYHFFIELTTFIVGFILFYAYFGQIPIVSTFINGLVSNTALIVATIGFILQNTIKNIIAGIMINYSNSFKIGDRVRLISKDIVGNIEKITLRHTIIRTYTNDRVIVPNSTLNEEVLINNDLLGSQSGYPILFPIKNSKQLPLAKTIIEDIVSDYTNKVDVSCNDILNDGTVILKVFIWTENIVESYQLASKIRYAVIYQFNEKDILI